jgi:hypothetical protein
MQITGISAIPKSSVQQRHRTCLTLPFAHRPNANYSAPTTPVQVRLGGYLRPEVRSGLHSAVICWRVQLQWFGAVRNTLCLVRKRGPGSSVGKATGYGLDGPGIEFILYSSLPRIFFRGGVQQIQLRTEGRQNGDLGAVAP